MDLQVMVGNLLMKEMEWCFTTLEREYTKVPIMDSHQETLVK